MNKRPTIPSGLRHQVNYDSAFACAVCAAKGDQIHHIDKDNSNNVYDNLILLCMAHHDEAHTTRELSQNLTPVRLKEIRARWYETVRERRFIAASASGQAANLDQFMRVGVSWGYINHSRLIQTAPKELLGHVDQGLFSRLKYRGYLDDRGIMIRPNNVEIASNFLRNTVYDWYPHMDSLSLHMFYSDLVDEFVKYFRPIHLDENSWNRAFIKEMIEPGSFVFINRAQYFKRTHEEQEYAEVSVRTFKRKIKLQYQLDTRNMFGTTSITCSFSGHKSCSSLLQVKSIEDVDKERVLHCTPIALGVGFHVKMPELLREA